MQDFDFLKDGATLDVHSGCHHLQPRDRSCYQLMKILKVLRDTADDMSDSEHVVLFEFCCCLFVFGSRAVFTACLVQNIALIMLNM